MTKFIIRWAIIAVALYVAVVIVNALIPGGIQLQSSSWLSFIWLALIFGVLNAVIGPLLKLMTCPLIILTLGLFTLLLNTLLFYLAGYLGTAFGVGFSVTGFLPAFLGAMVVSVVSVFLNLLVREDGNRRRWRRE
jgi:putative membrane protein